ncbi:hypothetical protein H072_8805 [Dactylellina haptotyla CBS 200.50]|uniref:MARVEL domain-containing protein n=1 Tax=Dactylellina haptotyla (strain CBS 200.50) TaxID=1284197 RepID=S8A3F9_DACHA|nr:hypothetical protein H072_8805 [Dactylellina haptotyla CBS 200.50]
MALTLVGIFAWIRTEIGNYNNGIANGFTPNGFNGGMSDGYSIMHHTRIGTNRDRIHDRIQDRIHNRIGHNFNDRFRNYPSNPGNMPTPYYNPYRGHDNYLNGGMNCINGICNGINGGNYVRGGANCINGNCDINGNYNYGNYNNFFNNLGNIYSILGTRSVDIALGVSVAAVLFTVFSIVTIFCLKGKLQIITAFTDIAICIAYVVAAIFYRNNFNADCKSTPLAVKLWRTRHKFQRYFNLDDLDFRACTVVRVGGILIIVMILLFFVSMIISVLITRSGKAAKKEVEIVHTHVPTRDV